MILLFVITNQFDLHFLKKYIKMFPIFLIFLHLVVGRHKINIRIFMEESIKTDSLLMGADRTKSEIISAVVDLSKQNWCFNNRKAQCFFGLLSEQLLC